MLKTTDLMSNRSNTWKMFDLIASRYDLLNRILSLGIDQYWRRILVRELPQSSALKWCDMATGTGDVIFKGISDRSDIKFDQINGIDMSQKMLDIAISKSASVSTPTKFDRMDAAKTTFSDRFFDVVTISFGIRNMPSVKDALSEMHRVLSDGGTALVLEFSMPTFLPLKWIYKFYFRTILPLVGGLISGNRDAYSYLNQSSEVFPSGSEFCQLMTDAGFNRVSHKPLTFGIATLYIAQK